MTRPVAAPDGETSAKPRGAALEHVIAIEAPARTVWAILANVDGWGAWNPVYRQAAGQLAVGASLALTIVLPGMAAQRSTATVYQAVPEQAVQFGAPAFLGLLHATRYIHVRPTSATSCTVVNGEAFSRLLGWPLAAMLGKTIAAGLRAQNEALKALAETRPGG